MSVPEYYQQTEDHRSILLLIKFLNLDLKDTLNEKHKNLFESIYSNCLNINETKLNNNNLNYERKIRIRFKKDNYNHKNNEWGDFQAHRKLLGLITIGFIEKTVDQNSQNDLNNLAEEFNDKHKNAVSEYSTLLNSKCVIFNLDKKNNNQYSDDNGNVLDNDNLVNKIIQLSETNSSQNNKQEDDSKNSSLKFKTEEISESNEQKNDTNNFITNKFTNCSLCEIDFIDDDYNINKIFKKVEQEIHDLVSSLFYVLESKRLDKSYEKQEKIPLLLAPFENKSIIGLDTDSKAFKKKCLGRMRKHIGDLCLLIGSPSEALLNYGVAIDLLRATNDLLWLSASLEGQCVASLCLLYPDQNFSNLVDFESENQSLNFFRKQNSFKRIFSLSSNKLKSSNSTPKNNSSVISYTKNSETPTNNIDKNYLKPNNQLNETPVPSKPKKINLTKRFLSNSSNESTKSFNGIDPYIAKTLGKALLTSDEEIYEKYKEACCHYAKFKMAAIIELECSLKATRVLASRGKFLQASEFIQNAVFISLESNPEKSVDKNKEKTCVIGQLYEEIGFRRKSAFYQRLTALQTISSRIEKLEKSNWEKCYYLLLPSIFGYHLNLDPFIYERRIQERDIGWTNIHLQLLQEMVTMSKRMGNDLLAMRHLSFILQALNESLTPTLKADLAKQLETLGANCGEGAPIPLVLNNGFTISSVNLTKYPIVTKFEIEPLKDNLKPIKIKNKRTENSSTSIPLSPFIFTPMQLNKSNRKKSLSAGHIKNVDFCWVQNEFCAVNIEVYNPLSIELKVNHMTLMTSDLIAFESKPVSFTLPPDSGPISVKITGKPVEAGKLEILGYTSHVLGVKNNCKLSDLPFAKKKKFPSKFVIEVIPSLPFLSISLLSPDYDLESNHADEISKQKDSHHIKLYAGQSKKYSLIFNNSSINDDVVEIINFKTTSQLPKELESKLISFDSTDIKNKLPLCSKNSIELNLNFYGLGEFVSIPTNDNVANKKISTTEITSNSLKKTQTTLSSTLVNFLSDLQSTPKHGPKQTNLEKVDSSKTIEFPSKKVNATLEIEYSGSNGLVSGFCRQAKINLELEILPSLLITKWDVLPEEPPNPCFLVFDVLNATSSEMEVCYSSNKAIVIENGDTCRFPVPVERCFLANEIEKINSENSISNQTKGKKNNQEFLQNIIKSHLAKQVKLNWKILQNTTNNQKIFGNANIYKVPWTIKMLNLISMCCIQFEVFLNDKEIKAEQELNFKLGEVISLKVKVYNWSSTSLNSLKLIVECFQDFDNGNRRYNLENKRGLMGTDNYFIEEIKSKQSIDHNLDFLFFYTGVYKIDLRCVRIDNRINHDSSNSHYKDCLNEASEWRFDPTIELNIVE